MANSFVRYTGNGSTTQYAVNFTYRDQADITVTINGVATTAFTYNSAGTQITFNTAPASASAIEIRRTTSQTSRLVDYAAGSVLTENDLDEIITHAQNMGKAPFLLVLDGVTDPHNLGAVLRSADAAGVDAVIVTKDKSASLNATVRKVACGAADVIPLIQVTNLSRTLAELQEKAIWVVGTAGEATQSVFDCKMNGPIALVMGAEGKGMRRLTRERCDELIKLPMHGTVSSLNVSVATGICLYEILRQRG